MHGLNTSEKLSHEVADYWTLINVTNHRRFASRAESLDYFHWRCDQYSGYLDLMPVKGFDGKSVLDYGCGPGHDLVGFFEYSRPENLVGADVSRSSLKETEARLALHGGRAAKLVLLNPETAQLPFADQSFDYIHSSGVLHHVPNLTQILGELRRILKPNGKCRVMVYNYDSIFLHLYVAYSLRLKQGTIPIDLPIRKAFERSTDGPDCPISRCYTSEEFGKEAAQAGFDCRLVGAAYSELERKTLAEDRYAAFMDERFEREHREFLLGLTFDDKGQALHRGIPAGVDLVLELTTSE